MKTEDKPCVYIVILNWNTWVETIPCLESVFKLNYPSVRILVCDNNSTNESVARMAAWLNGEISTLPLIDRDVRTQLSGPPVTKPIPYLLLTEDQLGDSGYDDSCLKIVRNAGNYGYAGGNNIGIRYAIGDPKCAAVWILNNDVLVTPDSLGHAMLVLRRSRGIVGSRVLNYSNGTLQSPGGGRYNKFTGKIKKLRPNFNNQYDILDYISGCAMLVPKSLFVEVGLLCQDYFLYYEEMDLAIRASEHGYGLFYASESVVYHKGSVTTGSSVLADFYQVRSRLVFSRKYFPFHYPFVFLAVCTSACVRAYRGQWKRALMIIHLLFDADMMYDAARWGA